MRRDNVVTKAFDPLEDLRGRDARRQRAVEAVDGTGAEELRDAPEGGLGPTGAGLGLQREQRRGMPRRRVLDRSRREGRPARLREGVREAGAHPGGGRRRRATA
ncbi:hypothetical protein [Methylobacterium crusticola]|uniref:hypothetical protein n=1 Tax=Methylobacterium crusticola TaxID=1697972 RepID=UPI000FFC9DCE|nr:hypothetical protein [Methylobacterium crusticola]